VCKAPGLVCTGSSSNLNHKDCAAWIGTVRSSSYFTKGNPPLCQEESYLEDPCSCSSVIGCNNGRIASLNFKNHNMTMFDASKDDSLSHLSGLVNMKFPDGLTGLVPVWLEKLAGTLTGIDLSYAKGPIDVLGKLTNLQSVFIGYNSGLNGTIAPLAKLTNLNYLNTDRASNLGGNLSSLSELTHLTYLQVGASKVRGSLGDIAKLTSLSNLNLDSLLLTGNFETIGKLSNLQSIELNNNRFTGTLDALTKLTKPVTYISLSPPLPPPPFSLG
jgi:hypothetical protein